MMHSRIVAVLMLFSFGVNSQATCEESELQNLARDARAILKATCHRCHGQDGTVEGGFSYVLDRPQLVARSQIVPRSPDNSRIIRRIKSGEMPPAGESPELSTEQIALLVKWIEAGAPDFDKTKPRRKFVTASDMVRTMSDELENATAADRPFIRFLILTHLYNAGRSDDEMLSYQHGVSKLLNSLSWGRRVVPAKPIGSPQTILRIDIRDYKWSAAVWDKLAAADPYALVFTSIPSAKRIYDDTACAMPYAHGNWFVAKAARPPLYHLVLQLPEKVQELETLLHVDADENIRTSQVARAGFNGSAVSRNNRMIERHDSSYGYYWKSYDFAKNVDRKNLFSHPLGPGTAETDFSHDGGEFIFSLPNGFQGYLLADAKGQRIDKGPTEIVSDPKQPDRAVENGLSCMSCHVRGLLPKDDQIRAHVLKNPTSFKKKEADAILSLYPEPRQFQKLIDEDSAKFRTATERAGIPAAITEPIMALATLFEKELDLSLAAAEAGLTPDEFQQVLAKSPQLGRELGSLLTDGGTVQRETFANSFAAIARAAKVGTPRARSTGAAEATTAAAPKDQPQGQANATNEGGWIELGGKNKYPALLLPNNQARSSKEGLSLPGPRTYLLTKKADFRDRDFKFELVYTNKEGGSGQLMHVGIGEEHKNNVCLGIYPPAFDKGGVELTNNILNIHNRIGAIGGPGPHRVTIEKTGDVLTLAIDVDNDGPSDDDIEATIPDIKAVTPALHKKNTHIFFGGGGTYHRMRLVELKGDK